MRYHAIEIQGPSSEMSQGVAECEVMSGISTVQQGAVDIEQIGVVVIPSEYLCLLCILSDSIHQPSPHSVNYPCPVTWVRLA
jgi:hypothetical protein